MLLQCCCVTIQLPANIKLHQSHIALALFFASPLNANWFSGFPVGIL